MVPTKLHCFFAAFAAFLAFSSEAFSPHSNSVRQQTLLFSISDDEAKNIVWRHVKKPLLRLGSKGASASHGNSLKQLLEDHTAVKVKVNTMPYDGSLQNAYDALRDLAVENGAPETIELIQMKDSDKIVLIGSPGIIDQVKAGSFPPPPPPPPPSPSSSDEREEY
ncbi:unnamed protein product [Cylindrotheca closterium]|uniref:Subtilisin n=1 Tax=Cylindrotheca closterium TaxID=2856 RepID=A0AAD2CEL2_9STRA|nr:unnamed protein product [Cylindrotheca closterium]CAJ1950660.1 unnamed protein product [Cylindrotheca closterium]